MDSRSETEWGGLTHGQAATNDPDPQYPPSANQSLMEVLANAEWVSSGRLVQESSPTLSLYMY